MYIDVIYELFRVQLYSSLCPQTFGHKKYSLLTKKIHIIEPLKLT